MDTPLRSRQEAAGAIVIEQDGRAIAQTFGNDAEAIAAAQSGVALYDRSHWGRLEVSDDDRIRFLHNQSTNNFESLKPGQGCDTVFVTSTARTIDLVSAYVLADRVLLLTSPGCGDRLMKWMDRFIFFADKVQITNVTDTTAAFSLIGPDSLALLSGLGLGDWDDQPYGSHTELDIQGIPTRIAVGSGLAIQGFTLITAADHAADLWGALVDATAVPLGDAAWQYLRIAQGRPMPDQELTDDYNPLEAGLWNAVSFDKGCYIGQETIARLDTYKGVKQQLWGIQLNREAEPGTVITDGDVKIGILTSVVQTENGPLGLGYIRTKAGGDGMTVNVGDAEGNVVEVPFLRRSRQDTPSP